jgi:LysM repeat protein
MIVIGTLLPVVAQAWSWSMLVEPFIGKTVSAAVTPSSEQSIQSAGAVEPAMNLDPAPATGGGDITIVDDSALVPEEGPSGTIADIVKPKNSKISTYVVHDGDTLGDIAKMFDVSVGTILSANDLPSGAKLHTGDKLVILPITGIDYTVKKGDTLASIA